MTLSWTPEFVSEVESRLVTHPAVKRALVRRPDANDPTPVVFVVAAGPSPPGADELNHFVAPSASTVECEFVVVDDAEASHAVGPGPRETLQLPRLVAAIWADVLGLDGVSSDDDFFDLGGDSLGAMQIASRVERVVGFEVPWAMFFDATTIKAFCDTLQTLEPRRGQSEGLAQLLGGADAECLRRASLDACV